MEKLLAIDTYEIYGSAYFTSVDQSVLSMLYQPIIGKEAYSLFMTLWAQWSLTKHEKILLQHHHLLLTSQASLQSFQAARKRLEGIGLLQSLVKKTEDDGHHYIYCLQRPLVPVDFFQDSILSVMLYERLGKRIYIERKRWFGLHEQAKPEIGFTDVTVPFNDVFLTGEKIFSHMKELKDDTVVKPSSEIAGQLKVINRSFDFELFLEGLSGAFTSREIFTQAMRNLIVKLAYIYDLNIFQMQRVVLDALDENGQLLEERLRKSAQKAYQAFTGNQVPKLYSMIETNEVNLQKSPQPQSKEEMLQLYLEQVSPVQFLTDFANGAKPSTGDLKIVEQIMLEQKLPIGVINVLLYYTLLKTNMKLSFPYVSKIAAHWSRKGIQTAKEAMDFAKAEQWTEKQKQVQAPSKPKNTRKVSRKEVVPTWMKADEEQGSKESLSQKEMQKLEERRKKIEAWLASDAKIKKEES